MSSDNVSNSTAEAQAAPRSASFWALLAYPLFFASGAAGLIYQVVWTRMLLARFGAGLYAVVAVLTAFMAGLALGSWLLGRVADRLGRPFRLYAVIEIAIGLCGLALPFIFMGVGALDKWAYGMFGGNFLVLTVVRFIIAFLAMIVPTTLMGATLPILSRFLVRQKEHLGLHVGGLYAINTFGAVAGAFLAGFVLIAVYGLLQTEFIAVALNVGVGALALAISAAIEKRPLPVDAAAGTSATQPKLSPDEQRKINWVLATVCIGGAVALAAQVLWSRMLIFNFEYLKNTTYSFSAMLTVFLAGLAIGSALIGPAIDRTDNPFRFYGMLVALIGVSIIASVVMLYNKGDVIFGEAFNPETNVFSWKLEVANIMLKTVVVLGLPTLLMGMAFPVAARVVVRMGQVGLGVGRLYSINTLGAIFGSLLAGFMLIPVFGLTWGLIVLGLIDLAMGLGVLLAAGGSRTPAIAMAALGGLFFLGTVTRIDHKNGLQRLTHPMDQVVFYEEGPLATVAVVEHNTRYRTIYVDGVGVAGTEPMLQTDQKSLAHVGSLLVKDPKSVLTVGFGSGGASYSFLLHDGIAQPHCVEICRTVLNAAHELTAANWNFFNDLHPMEFSRQDPRYEIILDDARAYLRYTDMTYDIIATDCTDLRYKSNANLYDLEYFQACRDRLNDGGMVVVWMPLAGLSSDMFNAALRTFNEVFPEMGIFYMSNEPTHYILLVGTKEKLQFDFRDLVAGLEETDVRRDLAELYLDDPVKIMSCFITGGEVLREYLGEGQLNTENNPVIEFQSPKYGYGDEPLLDNLADLMDIYVSPREFIVAETITEEESQKLERFERALPRILAGHAAFRNMKIDTATREYMAAAEITPDDLSVTRDLLTFPLLQIRTQNEPSDPYFPMMLGRSLMLQGELNFSKYESAWDMLEEAKERSLARLRGNPGDPGMYQAFLRTCEAWQQEILAARRNREQQ